MTNEHQFVTTHGLDFFVAQSPYDNEQKIFRVGTCKGQWGSVTDAYYILSVINSKPGNGHLDDVFEWFEHSCKRDGKNLLVLECGFNPRFYQHLISKRGFVPLDADCDNVIKVFNKKAHRKLLKKGNEILIKGTLKCV